MIRGSGVDCNHFRAAARSRSHNRHGGARLAHAARQGCARRCRRNPPPARARPGGRAPARRADRSRQSRLSDRGNTGIAGPPNPASNGSARLPMSESVWRRVGDRRAAVHLWRRRTQSVARSGRLRTPDGRQRRSRMPRSGASWRDRPSVPPAQYRGLAAAIAAIAGDPGRRASMGRAGRALVNRSLPRISLPRDACGLSRRSK